MNHTVKVYVQLLEEGVATWRPTEAKSNSDDTYTLLATTNYDPETEIWEFLPGSKVRLEIHRFGDGSEGLVARA